MIRTPLGHALRDARASAAGAERPRTFTRREFLGRAGALGAGLALSGALARCAPAPEKGRVRVAIVGAGLAGLTCARRLKQAGIQARVYEASDRVGGRCRTLRDFFEKGQYVELGGEFIDSGHAAIRRLAGEFDLELKNLWRAEPAGLRPVYHFGGSTYAQQDASDDLRAILPIARSDARAAGYPTRRDRHTPRGYDLDHTSVAEWIEKNVPGGLGSRLGGLLDVAYTTEYGLETSEQSALNLVYFLGYSPKDDPQLYGDSDERYTIAGGNDLLVEALAEGLDDELELGTELVSLGRKADGSYTLALRRDQASRDVTADKVVLALPFSVMRASVDLSGSGFSKPKKEAVEKLGMGTNSKLLVQFGGRPWRSSGLSGETYSDTGYQLTWETTVGQPGSRGILVDYTGGRYGETFGSGTGEELSRRFFSQLDPVIPGLSRDFDGRARVAFWPGNPWSRGSYSCYRVGQYTSFSGIEGEREGNCHFAGEHTSFESQGYLNGAVESGERAAHEILRDLR